MFDKLSKALRIEKVWSYIKEPIPVTSVSLTVVIFIFIFDKNLIGDYQLQRFLNNNESSFLANIFKYSFPLYCKVIFSILILIFILMMLCLLLEGSRCLIEWKKLPKFKEKIKLEVIYDFVNKYILNIFSAIFRLFRILWRLTNGLFLIITVLLILFYGQPFLSDIITFEIHHLYNFSNFENVAFYISLLINLIFSVFYSLHCLFKKDDELPF